VAVGKRRGRTAQEWRQKEENKGIVDEMHHLGSVSNVNKPRAVPVVWTFVVIDYVS